MVIISPQRCFATQDIPISESSSIDKEIIMPPVFVENGYPSSLKDIILENFNKTPLQIRKLFVEEGWSIHLGIRINRKLNYSSLIKGYTDLTYKRIWIDNRDVCVGTIFHEIGHFVEFNSGNPENSDLFHNIYVNEVNVFRSIYNTNIHNTSSEVEYFAEAFQVYLQNPELLQSYCPNTFNFIQNCVSNFE